MTKLGTFLSNLDIAVFLQEKYTFLIPINKEIHTMEHELKNLIVDLVEKATDTDLLDLIFRLLLLSI